MVKRLTALALIMSLVFPLHGCSGGGTPADALDQDPAASHGQEYWFGSSVKAAVPPVSIMGELHNAILEESMTHAAASKSEITPAVIKAEIERAARIVGGSSIPPDADVAGWIEIACNTAPADCGNFLNAIGEIADPWQRAWAEGLIMAVSGLDSSTAVKIAVTEYGMEHGFPTTEPLISFLNVLVHSSEYWDTHPTANKKDGAVFAADAVGVIRGGLQGLLIGSPVGGLIGGAIYGAVYSWLMATALDDGG